MNVPRMGICGRKPILVFFSVLPPIVLIALVFFCSESTEGGGERILGQWLVGSVRCSSFFLFSICALLCSDWEVLCLLTSLFSAWWVVLLIKPYHWYQPETPCPIISIADEPIATPQLAILLPTCLCSYPRPTTCKAKVNGKWMVVQVWSHFPNHLMMLSDCRRGRWSRWRRAQWTFARAGKSEQSTSRMCLSLWCLLVVVSDWWNKWWVIQPYHVSTCRLRTLTLHARLPMEGGSGLLRRYRAGKN